jgi:hypothetical protein
MLVMTNPVAAPNPLAVSPRGVARRRLLLFEEPSTYLATTDRPRTQVRRYRLALMRTAPSTREASAQNTAEKQRLRLVRRAHD